MKEFAKDNFELLKQDFEEKFGFKWNKDPHLYIKFYQARVLDAMLLVFNDSATKDLAAQKAHHSALENLRKAVTKFDKKLPG